MKEMSITRNNILDTINLFGVAPKHWLLSIPKVYNLQQNKTKITKILASLKFEKFIKEKEENGKKFVFATGKGFEKLPHHLQTNYIKNPKVNQTKDTNHNQIIFCFLLEF